MWHLFVEIQKMPEEFAFYHKHAVYLRDTKLPKQLHRHFVNKLNWYGANKIDGVRIFYNPRRDELMAGRFNIEFIECQLTANDEKKLLAFAKSYDNDLSVIIEKINSYGYTIKIGFYPDSTAYGVFMQAGKDTKENKGKMLSSWSDDVGEAIAMCLYKHEVMFSAGEWEQSADYRGKWG